VFAETKLSRPNQRTDRPASGPAAKDGYVGSVACVECHARISASFSQTRMGRSLTTISPATVAKLPIPASFDNPAVNRHFDVFSQNGKLYQSEYAIGPGGDVIFRNTQEVKWIIGAGANGYSGLVQRGEYLFEAPLSFFTTPQRWESSPGYEQRDIGFHRPVIAACISCHSGRPNPADEETGKFAPIPFDQTPIGCENCHGPGAAHVRSMRPGGDRSQGSLIVNPGKLSADRENDICMSCHEAGDARVPRPGKTYQDFRPGAPLDETVSILMAPLKPGDPDARDHVQHYFEMSMSKCFRASARQLRCATCHDPHFQPTAAETPAFFNQKCMTCHDGQSCTAPGAARHSTAPSDNCIGCHMPRRDAPETAHTSLTNHRILARPGEPWPDEAFRQATPELPDLVHLNRVRGAEEHVSELDLLEAYRQIAERKPDYAAAYNRTLTDLEQTNPDHAAVQEGLGRRELSSGSVDQAIAHLRRAIELNPQGGMAYSLLSEALARRGNLDEAIASSEKAVSLAPYEQLYQKSLIHHLIEARQYDKATAAMEHYMELFPEDDFMRNMLKVARQ
jgi:hypothetical protein